MLREIILIDEEKCNGCGKCIPGCPEGALQVIDGKARLISDLFCDGLGACIGECPLDAIKVVKREAEPYDETKVMQNIMKKGNNTIKAHLSHLKDQGEDDLYTQAIDVLKENGYNISDFEEQEPENFHHHEGGGCPGSRMIDMNDNDATSMTGDTSSQLKQWPVQMHLISPNAPYFKNSDLLIAADCTAFSCGNFHSQFLKGKSLVIACPKLDSGMETYIEKITSLIDDAKVNTISVLVMEVPCCSGLLQMVKQASEKATRKVPIKLTIVDLQGNILQDDWV